MCCCKGGRFLLRCGACPCAGASPVGLGLRMARCVRDATWEAGAPDISCRARTVLASLRNSPGTICPELHVLRNGATQLRSFPTSSGISCFRSRHMSQTNRPMLAACTRTCRVLKTEPFHGGAPFIRPKRPPSTWPPFFPSFIVRALSVLARRRFGFSEAPESGVRNSGPTSGCCNVL